MSALTMKFINEVNPILKPYIRHYWMTSGKLETKETTILLPMDHIDLIIPIRGKFYYSLHDSISDADGIVFHGMRRQSVAIKQDKSVVAYGITFEPWGFYPFIKKPLIHYIDKVVALSTQDEDLSLSIRECFKKDNDMDCSIKNLEEILIDQLTDAPQYEKELGIIKSFIGVERTTIESFCDRFYINRKRLERIFNKYVGMSPKDFLKVKQFEEASRNVMFNECARLTDIALEEDYYDQSHFIKDFRQYTDYSPTAFKKNKPALKSKFKFD